MPNPNTDIQLNDQDRSKLDGIVQKMIANGESDDNIHAVVNDFKQKYGATGQSQQNTDPFAPFKILHQLQAENQNTQQNKQQPVQNAQPQNPSNANFQPVRNAQVPPNMPVSDNTRVASNNAPNIADVENAAQQRKSQVQKAINTTAINRLKAKGINPTLPLIAKEKENVQQQLNDGDLSTYTDDKGNVQLGADAGIFAGVAHGLANVFNDLQYGGDVIQARIQEDDDKLAKLNDEYIKNKEFINNHPFKALWGGVTDEDRNQEDTPENHLTYNGVGSQFGNWTSGTAASLGALAIPGAGEAEAAGGAGATLAANAPRMLAGATQTYLQGLPQRVESNYHENLLKNLNNGMSETEAKKAAIHKATNDALTQQVLPSAVGGAFFSGAFGGNAAADNFMDALMHTMKNGAKFSGVQGTQAAVDDLIKKWQGYKTDMPNDILEGMKSGLEQTAAMELLPYSLKLPKYMQSSLYNYATKFADATGITQKINDAVGNGIINQDEANKILANMSDFKKTADQLSPYVDDSHLPTVAGLTSKINSIRQDKMNLEVQKATVPSALHPQINEAINNLNQQESALNDRIGEAMNAQNPLDVEYDDQTGDKVTGNPNQPTPSESKPEPQTEPTVGDVFGKRVTYKDQKGELSQDGQTVIFTPYENPNREYEVGNIDELKDQPISDVGIGHEPSVVATTDKGGITVRGVEYKNNYSDPLQAINYDKDGKVVSVNLETTDGKKRTFRGDVADDLADQIKNPDKYITNNKTAENATQKSNEQQSESDTESSIGEREGTVQQRDEAENTPTDNSNRRSSSESEEKEVNNNENAVNSQNDEQQPERTKAGMDNGRSMVESAVDKLVGRPEERSGIYKTIEASNSAGSDGTIRTAEEREELEGRGLNPDWSKPKFRAELKRNAQDNGVWLDKSYLDDKTLLHDQKQAQTSENDVYLNPDGKTVTKVNNLSYVTGDKSHNSLNGAIDRLKAHNDLFPETPYTIKGFMENKNGFPSMVLEQPYIKDVERNATQQEIDDYLSQRGFKKDGERDWSNGHEVWTNGKYELFDARPANVLKGKDGNLYFIDTIPHTVESSESKVAPAEKKEQPESSSNNTVGVSHEALNNLMRKVGLPEIERGKTISNEELANMGREFVKNGIDPNTVLDSDLKQHEKISIARAYEENLKKESDAAANKHGVDSNEYKDAIKKLYDFSENVTKKLGTEAHLAFKALQGERDLDTDSFTVMSHNLKEKLGRDLTDSERVKVKEITDNIQDSKSELKKASDKAKEDLIKENGKDGEKMSVEQKRIKREERQKARIQKVDKFFDDAIAKIGDKGVMYSTLIPPDVIKLALKGMKEAYHAGESIYSAVSNAVDLISEKVGDNWDKEKFRREYFAAFERMTKAATPEEENIRRLEKQLDALKRGETKEKIPKRELSAREMDLKDQIRKQKEAMGVIDKKLSPEEKLANTVRDLHTQMQSGGKMQPQHAKAIWDYINKNHFDKGEELTDAIADTAKELGLTTKQVEDAIVSPKTKPLTTEAWSRRNKLARQRSEAKRYVDNARMNPALKAAGKVSAAVREVSTEGHFSVFTGTHAMSAVLDYRHFNKAIHSYLNTWKLALSNDANYERAIVDIKNRPLYDIALESKLKCDVDKSAFNDSDSEIQNTLQLNSDKSNNKIIKTLKGIHNAGNKAYTALKILRLDIFEQKYNALTEAQKNDKEILKRIAESANNMTNAANVKIPKALNEIAFAPQMEAAKWKTLLINPAKMITIPLDRLMRGEKLSQADRWFIKETAIHTGSNVAAFLATRAVLLAIQNYFHPDKKVDLSDWHNWIGTDVQWNDYHFGITSGLGATAKFIYSTIPSILAGNEKTWNGEHWWEYKLPTYARGKLAPFYSLLANIYTGKDFQGNVLPVHIVKYDTKDYYGKKVKTEIKPAPWGHVMDWKEFLLKQTPIPVAEAFTQYYEEARKKGASSHDVNAVTHSILLGLLSGSTGIRGYEKEDNKRHNHN